MGQLASFGPCNLTPFSLKREAVDGRFDGHTAAAQLWLGLLEFGGAGLDEGLLSLTLSILVCMDHYDMNNRQQ